MNCPGSSPLGCTPCTWIASFQEYVSSPTSPQPSLPPHFSNAYSCCSFLSMSEMGSWGFFWWADALKHLGFFHKFHSWLGMGCAQHLAEATLQPQLLKPAQRSTQAELLGCWCTNWLWLVHGIFESSSINCLGINAWADWVLMHKTHPSSLSYLGAHAWSVGVLKHDLIGHSSIHWLGTCVPLTGCSCMYQLGSHAQTNHVLMH